jgi:Xaa-Pro aminopeptidase
MFLNVNRARALMREFQIDALIASTPENVTYLAGTVGWAHKVYAYSVHMFAVFPLSEDVSPALIVPNQEVTYLSAQNSWIKDHYTFGSKSTMILSEGESAQTPEEETFLGMMNNDDRRGKNIAVALAQALRERGLTNARLALDGERIMPNVRGQVMNELSRATVLDGADLFRLIRMVKTPDELDSLRSAGELNDRAATVASNAIEDGATELEVATVYRTEVARGGGMWHWFHFVSGRRSVGIFPPSEKKIQKGESWIFDAGLTLNNFRADTAWGGVVGEPTKDQLKLWNASKAGYDAALSVIQAGVLPSEIFHAALDATRGAGMPEHDGRFVGHAIGLEARELPYVLADPSRVKSDFLPPTTDIPIETGTTLCIENPCRAFGIGGATEECTIVVTENGCEPLFPQERKLWVVPA